MEPDRRVILENLLTLSRPLPQLKQELAAFGFDYGGEPVELSANELAAVLQKFLDGLIPATAVEDWADLIEVREDVDYPESQKDVISDIIYQLANPVLEGSLDADKAREFLALLT